MTGDPWDNDPIVAPAKAGGASTPPVATTPMPPAVPMAAPAAPMAVAPPSDTVAYSADSAPVSSGDEPWHKDPILHPAAAAGQPPTHVATADSNAAAKVVDVQAPTERHFGMDILPKEATTQVAPDVKAHIVSLLANEPIDTAAATARKYAKDNGFDDSNFDAVIDARRKGAGVNKNLEVHLPTPAPVINNGGLVQNATDRAGYGGIADAVSLGGANKLYAGISAGNDWLGGKTPNGLGDAYNRYLDQNNARTADDEANHPYARVAGLLLGGLAINPELAPVALEAGTTALRAGKTMLEARKAAAQAVVLQQAKVGAMQGAGYGVLSSDNLHDAAVGGVAGAATGAVAGAALTAGGQAAAKYGGRALDGLANGPVGAFATRVAPVTQPLDANALRGVQAAQDLGIALPKFAATDAGRAEAGALEQMPFGRAPIVAAKQALTDTAVAARNKIATDVGTPIENDADLGDAAKTYAINQMKSKRSAIGGIYDQAEAAAQNMPVPATNTISNLNGLISQQGEALGGTKVGEILQNKLDDLVNNKGGNLTINGARLTRTALRDSLTNEAGLTPSDADRIVQNVMGSINTDMENGLKDAGKVAAVNLYHTADRQWAQQLGHEDDVLRKILGPTMENTGEDVARKLNSEVKNNGTRLGKFLGSLPDDEANNIRATFLQRLGKASDATQNADGDRTSLGVALTNINQMKGARNIIFSPETNAVLDKFAQVADLAKQAEAMRNHPNTGGVFSRLMGMAGGATIGIALLTKPEIAGAAISVAALTALKQNVSARLLANPNFARKILSTPNTLQGAASYWSRPWVQTMAAKSPAIANEIGLFQSGLLKAVNDNMVATHMAAASNGSIAPAVTSSGPIQQKRSQGHGANPAQR